FVVEDVDRLVEACLSLQEIPCSGFGGFFFQGEMHAFVTTVLLRVGRLDAFNANAEPQPPDGESVHHSSLGRWPKERGVPCARRRTRPRRSTRPWRSSTAWMVLFAGILIPENLRIRRSRILRAPQLACSCFTFRMKFSLEKGSCGATW